MDFIDISLTDNQENYINLNNQHWNITLLFNVVSDKYRLHIKILF